MAGKSELIDYVAKGTGATKADVSVGIDKVFEAISNITGQGDRVTIKGFGSFEMKTSKPKTGRNPQTGEAIQIAAKTTLKFKASK